MTIILEHNQKGIDQLVQIVQRWIFPNIAQEDRERIMQHFDWMRQQPGNMSVNCRVETEEASQKTRIVLEASFNELPSWKDPRRKQ